MAISTASHRSLDNHLVTVSGPDLDFSFPWSASILCLKGSSPFGFQSGPGNNWEHLMIGFPAFEFAESYDYQGGQLRIGSAQTSEGVDPELTGAEGAFRIWLWYWQASLYSLAFIANRVNEGDRPDFLEWFESFDLSESSEGITLAPRTPTEIRVSGVEVVKEVPRLGLLSIYDRASASQLVPTWSGTQVDGGELFVSRPSEDLPAFFLLAGDTAATIVQPLGDEPLETPERMKALEHVTIDWK